MYRLFLPARSTPQRTFTTSANPPPQVSLRSNPNANNTSIVILEQVMPFPWSTLPAAIDQLHNNGLGESNAAKVAGAGALSSHTTLQIVYDKDYNLFPIRPDADQKLSEDLDERVSQFLLLEGVGVLEDSDLMTSRSILKKLGLESQGSLGRSLSLASI